MKSKMLLLPLMLILASTIAEASSLTDTTLTDSYILHVQNQNYTVTHNMSFSSIEYTTSTCRFNNTRFSITSANPINITLQYLDENILYKMTHATVLSFYAKTNTGTVQFSISGFKHSTEYLVYRGPIPLCYVTSDASGTITFPNTAWSEHIFIITDYDTGYIPIESSPETNYLVQTIIPLMIAIALIVTLVALFFTGTMDIKTLIMYMVMVVIAIAVVMTII